MKYLVLAGLLLMGCARQSYAQWPVTDAGNLLQNTTTAINSVITATNTAAQYVRQGEQIVNEYNIILNQIKQYETMVKNLARLPEGLNILQTVTLLNSRIAGLLGGATIVSYDLNRVTGQFDALYQQIGTLSNPSDVLALRRRLLNGRMETSQITVQVTAIKANLAEMYTRLCALLDGGHTAQGNLDIQQVQVQQNGLMQQTLESIASMQAANARIGAQWQAEAAALERLHLQAIEGAMGSTVPFGEPQGKLPTFRW